MILDYIEKLELADDSDEQSFYSRNALAQLANGLFYLNSEVSRIERGYLGKTNQDEDEIQFVGKLIEKLPIGRLCSMFQWYAVSACNYARLVGWLVKQDSQFAISYVKEVMPKLYKYRNKVAAHFALTKPDKDDNEADQEASIRAHICIKGKHIYLAAISPVIQIEGKEVSSNQKFSWSLTQVHKLLIKRYWPNTEPKYSTKLMILAGETITANIDWSETL
jgi:hypothetical protein